jgi:spermidine synthase/tetratricopeptide (TPR) repeat protein
MSISLAALFFLSGWTGLVYEVLWAKYLALTLGSTAAAHTFVLSAFLGGMAAGYAAIGRFADRHPNPLLLYAKLEFAIAGLGALAPFLLGGIWGLPLIPFAAGFMGGTLPALSRIASVPFLYFLNSLGAAAGSLFAAFVLIPRFGLDVSGWIAAGVNAAVGAAALRLARNPVPPPKPPWPEPELPAPRLFYATAFASGFVSLALEIAWIRLLAMMFGSTVYSFAIMLAAFIAGIGAGSLLIASKAASRLPSLRTLVILQFLAAAALLATLPFYERVAYLPIWIDALLESRQGMFLAFETAKFGFCFALMFVPAACFGMVPPLAARAAARESGDLAARVGTVFAWNAGGNVLGAAAAGLWLLPALGLQGLFHAGAAMLAAIGAALMLADRSLRLSRAWAAVPLAVVAGALALSPAWEPIQISFGGVREKMVEELSYEHYRKALSRFTLLYHADGREATVSVIEYTKGSRALKINGKTDASTTRDLRTQVLLAQIPLLLHPSPAAVLVVGLGSGITVGSALTHDPARVDLVEISPEVVEAERWFREANGDALSDSRVSTVVSDGRTFLMRGDRRYDAIISEPSNPWMAGIGALFTAEFYAQARRRLKPGGIMAQWFHFYEMRESTLRLLLRTFTSEFPHASVWMTMSGDILLLGSQAPLPVPGPDFSKRWARPDVAADLARAGIDRPVTLLSLQIGSNEAVREWAGEGPLNRDRFPRLEYAAPKGRFLRKRANLLFIEDEGARPDRSGGLFLAKHLTRRGAPLTPGEYDAIDAFHAGYRYRFRERHSRDWMNAFPDDPRSWLAAARVDEDDASIRPARDIVEAGLKRIPKSAALLDKAAEYAEKDFIENGNAEAGREALALLRRLPVNVDTERRAAKLHRELGEFEAALERLQSAAELADRNRAAEADEIWMDVAELALEKERGTLVMDALERALAANPDNRDARDLLDTLMRHFEEKP